MLEDAAENVKRYAPPPQRNRVLNRRKSGGDRQVNYSYGHSGEKSQRLIPIAGCHSSEAAKLLNERWATAVHSYDEPTTDLSSERPIMYLGASDSSWAAQLKFPHQMDFLAELRRAIQSSDRTAV
ncbi:unnamed protein product [Spirodela intermedia]|uniref:Uncharacterized protein n=1 Tax=Spirodela intermedia TaxID=51605 RepID=A0A7I8JDM1_SPIIN|nr:unnamed protein product [Spirodela intermedia]CAA6668274.1 unnamed protein product [Spirodela intermedia]